MAIEHKTLSAERRDVAIARINRGARVVFSRMGKTATMDDIAEEAGVSRRTLFRYFPTKGALAISAYRDGMERFGKLPPRGDDAPEVWLRKAVAHVYETAATSGPGLIEVIITEEDGQLGEVARMLREGGRERAAEAARECWRASGAKGRPPRWLAHSFSLTLSTLGRFAIGYSAPDDEEAIDAGSNLLVAALRHALAERHVVRDGSALS